MPGVSEPSHVYTPGALGYAVLLSVPVGVGVVLAFGATLGRLTPLAVASGALATLVVFVLVLAGARGPAEPGAQGANAGTEAGANENADADADAETDPEAPHDEQGSER